MGQYYRPVILDGSDVIVYNLYVNGKRSGLKLTEHSWMDNDCINKVCQRIYKHPCRIVWVGDYNKQPIPNIPIAQAEVWENESIPVEIPDNPLENIKEKILVNHDKKFTVNLTDFYEKCKDEEGYCLHPLPLLTWCTTEGGGGDYHGINQENLGNWSGDLISVEDPNWIKPDMYKSLLYEFKENY